MIIKHSIVTKTASNIKQRRHNWKAGLGNSTVKLLLVLDLWVQTRKKIKITASWSLSTSLEGKGCEGK